MGKRMNRGMAVAIGPWFIVVPKAEINRRGIKLRKLDEAVYVNEKGQPLWGQQYWNQDRLMKSLFKANKKRYLIEDYLIDDKAIEEDMIARGELEVVYNGYTGEPMLRIVNDAIPAF